MSDNTEDLFMDDEVRAFGMELGKQALAKNWTAVRMKLAPWLQKRYSVDDVRLFFENEYKATLAEVGIDELRYPEYLEPELGGNSFTKAIQLREPISWEGGKVRPIDPAVTDENVRWWLSMQLCCSDEQMAELGIDYFCEIWMAVVDTEEGIMLGYWSQGAY